MTSPGDQHRAPAGGGGPAGGRTPQGRPRLGTAGRFGIGAAIGAGLVARSAVRGGADFILALNAGRVRVMGAPSAVCMLPIHESNAFVAAFARTEILGRVDVPVLFGASTFDPRTDVEALVGQIAAWGFSGVINFPSVILLDPEARAGMERLGLGWRREVALIEAARRAGLLAAAYVRTVEQGADMAAAGSDLVCVNFGWTTGGVAGEPATQDTAGAAAEAAAVFRTARRLRPKILCFVEGGPIATPQGAAEVCRASRADGYIASSTVDRIPLETAVSDTAAAFKAVAGLTRKVEALENELLGDGRRFGLIGCSAAMAHLVRMIERLADSDLTVLIRGESGTGKELVAQALHRASRRCDRPLVAVNCAAIPRDLLESELFGYERGAFTGASRSRLGRFEEANGGTLFLDEIGDLDLPLQGKLLRILESGVVERLGSNQPHRLDVRVLCATHRDLRAASAEGRFREDLFFRLAQLEIRVPSLAERIEDIPLLARQFLSAFAARHGGPPKVIDNAAYQRLMSHRWAGNVRELRNVVQQAAILGDREVIGAADLIPLLDAPAAAAPGRAAARPATPAPAPSTAETERDWIVEALRRNRFRRDATARDLGLSRKTLYNKMRHYGIA
ncbi:phosphoenolpyruvate hydrolase family protein [Rhodoplanes sp. TEM]|uniref:Phosphoenolpyruvate hydrolase family protein n=1 Tax=Rhodoplanes tepidamans TaxID=200616 RepID=A0ABT5JIK9_RHOTP|nr:MULTISPECIES: phosphoenolpyruvate hydrolase family protein [Rhodoplanes]MDC7789367.1 phosphoenolpyruvate hydrolase family protein [Rhodoplanes tepidamans]MDC7987742.1 phosphoenolpyruvate hydrolase family protein [Rhodoplanes sp. TEM]MDQ0358474.1 DNA-binding NtrC family response regulator/predicted TIM-barrel enzyme [Rhodoplanes tepidamans]